MNLDALLAVVTPLALVTSAIFGFIIGATYGYMLAHGDMPARYPMALWVTGLLFILTLSLLNRIGATSTGGLFESQLGRAILWTIVVSAIPIGRLSRAYVTLWLAQHKRRRL